MPDVTRVGTRDAPARHSADPEQQAKLPILPTLNVSMWRGHASSCYESPFLASGVTFLVSGTAALANAMQDIGVGGGDRVLVPAYHCRAAMVEPIRRAGAEPVLYRTLPDLRPDPDDVRRKLQRPAKALIVAHYFGFLQEIATLGEMCAGAGARLIEDCAHAFFGRVGSQMPGQYADYAIASSRKFFPGSDGGMLLRRPGQPSRAHLQRPGWLAEAKGLASAVQFAARYGKLGPASAPLGLLCRFLDTLVRSGSDLVPEDGSRAAGCTTGVTTGSGGQYQLAGRHVSRLLIRISNKARIAELRRRNYSRLLECAVGLRAAQPLYANLPENVVPYMFPLLLDKPDAQFRELRGRGVPMYRWEDLAPGSCPISQSYRHRLVQLPCHQDLSPQDMDWLTLQLGEVLSDRQHA
jgi:dTDP-4-amino-4,6-dideoxygalactose transaminase